MNDDLHTFFNHTGQQEIAVTNIRCDIYMPSPLCRINDTNLDLQVKLNGIHLKHLHIFMYKMYVS